MSIIHDALKKVQKNLPGLASSDNTQKNADNVQPAESFPGTKPAHIQPPSAGLQKPSSPGVVKKTAGDPGQNNKNKIFLIAASLSCLVLIGSLLFFLQNQQKQQVTVTPQKTNTPSLIFSSGKKPQVSQPEITIKGVMTTGGENLALINEDIYEEGDFFKDIKIVEITPDSVTILDRGEMKTLQVRTAD